MIAFIVKKGLIMKYRFRVLYAPKFMQEASSLMKNLDLDFGQAGIETKFEFTTSNPIPISELKKQIAKAFESDESKVLFIEGGSIE
jgi:hypothetical protein